MRILKLTSKTEAALLELRETHDREAYRIASRIVADVQKRGDRALLSWSAKLDGDQIRKKGLWISREEMAAACRRVDRNFLSSVEHAAANVRRVAEKQLPQEWKLRVENGVTIRQLVRPLDSIGCYIPGGRFALLSTLVMTVVPAQVAAVPRIFEKVHNKMITGAQQKGGATLRIFRWAFAAGARYSAQVRLGERPSPWLQLQYRIADKLVFSKLRARFGRLRSDPDPLLEPSRSGVARPSQRDVRPAA